ncbi:hypothetical protein BH09ACT8_BH09ACT8_40820 [soil metagenome]
MSDGNHGAGRRLFAEALAGRWPHLAGRVAAPIRIAVHGRPGVGVATTRAALASAGLEITVADGEAEVAIRVVAEVAKFEDLTNSYDLAVLNKADLTGFGPGGPLVAAQRRCTRVAGLLGAPTEPMVALLAVAAQDSEVLDECLIDALRVLVDEPADLRSPDHFVTCAHRLSREVRQRLVESLDLFGIAHSVVTLRRDRRAGAAEVRAELRRVSRLDRVVARVMAAVVDAGYRRVLAVVDELQVLAVTDAQIAAFLAAEDTVLARMAAAVDVIEGAGLRVDPADDAAAHLRRAVQWRQFAAGPLGALHRDCAADIARGSLRLLASAMSSTATSSSATFSGGAP